jgi:pilus assembly protein Flp/PilA
MDPIAPHLSKFVADERGATAIEYCLIAGLMSIVIAAGATQIGQSVLAFFQTAAAGLQ